MKEAKRNPRESAVIRDGSRTWLHQNHQASRRRHFEGEGVMLHIHGPFIFRFINRSQHVLSWRDSHSMEMKYAFLHIPRLMIGVDYKFNREVNGRASISLGGLAFRASPRRGVQFLRSTICHNSSNHVIACEAYNNNYNNEKSMHIMHILAHSMTNSCHFSHFDGSV